MRAVKGSLGHSSGRDEKKEEMLVRRVQLGEEGMEPDDLLCSRNARSKTLLVGRARWKINQPPPIDR
jgi:hypothetical protein